MTAPRRADLPREDAHVFRVSDVVDGALQLASTRLRNVARLERAVSTEVVRAEISLGELTRSFAELVCAAARQLDEPRPGANRWLRIEASVKGNSVELSVEHGAATGSRSAIVVTLGPLEG